MSGWGLGLLLASLEERESDRLRRQGERYDREIREALDRGLPYTAMRIAAERREWAADAARADRQ